jgi:CHASE3 domain sensor protein
VALSVRRRIQGLVAAFVALATVLGVFGAVTVQTRDAALREITEVVEPARQQTTVLFEAYDDQQNELRTYLLTRDERHLEAHRSALTDAERAAVELDRLLVEHPELRRGLADALDAAATWRDQAARPMLELAADGRWDEAAALVGQAADTGHFEEVRSAIRGLLASLRERFAALSERAGGARARLNFVVVAALGTALALAAAVAVLTSRWLTRPLAEIGAAVDRVAQGELHSAIPAVGPPDTAALARNVENMRAATVGLLDRAEAAREALEQQGTAVVLLRDELRPSDAKLPAGVTTAAAMLPAEGILAGDWYDVVDRGDGHVVALVVDVAGHGPRAGMLALHAKHLLLAALRMRLQPGEALDWVNEHIGETGERFLTCIVLDLELETGMCQYANAGHPPGMLLVPGRDPSGNAVQMLAATGPLLGPLAARWRTERIMLPGMGMVMLYTDGLIEARSGDAQFGEARVREIVLTEGVNGPEAVLDSVLHQARAFASGRFDDDVTVVAVARTRPRPSGERTRARAASMTS